MSCLDTLLGKQACNHTGGFPGKGNTVFPISYTSFVFEKYSFKCRTADTAVNDLEWKSYEAVPIQATGFTVFTYCFEASKIR